MTDTESSSELQLSKSIKALRELIKKECLIEEGVFPLVDDEQAFEVWKTNPLKPFTKARIVGLENEVAKEWLMVLIFKEDIDTSSYDNGGKTASTAQELEKSSTKSTTPLSDLSRMLMTNNSDEPTTSNNNNNNNNNNSSLLSLLTKWKSLNASNFVPIDRIHSTSEYIFLFTSLSSSSSDFFTMGSFLRYNRHLLRHAKESPASSSSPSAIPPVFTEGPPLLNGDPILPTEDDTPALFLFYQCLQALFDFRELSNNQPHGGCSFGDSFHVSNALWVQLFPPLGRKRSETHAVNYTKEWLNRRVSTFEYLVRVNQASGRRSGGLGAFHSIFPWLTDFNGSTRDLRKSKFRLKKGDEQLEATFAAPPPAAPHHIPESLSDLTFYVYASRITPVHVLRQVVRNNFEAKEYPATLARLFEWTPDECTLEFFVDERVFQASALLPALEPDPLAFLKHHRALLESDQTRAHLPHWIDLNFGAGLSGLAAVAEKNVPLVLPRAAPNFVQVFSKPHVREGADPASGKVSAQRCLAAVMKCMIGAKDGLPLHTANTFVGAALVEWLERRRVRDAGLVAQAMLDSGFFFHVAGDREFRNSREAIYRFRDAGDEVLPRRLVSVPFDVAANLARAEEDGLVESGRGNEGDFADLAGLVRRVYFQGRPISSRVNHILALLESRQSLTRGEADSLFPPHVRAAYARSRASSSTLGAFEERRGEVEGFKNQATAKQVLAHQDACVTAMSHKLEWLVTGSARGEVALFKATRSEVRKLGASSAAGTGSVEAISWLGQGNGIGLLRRGVLESMDATRLDECDTWVSANVKCFEPISNDSMLIAYGLTSPTRASWLGLFDARAGKLQQEVSLTNPTHFIRCVQRSQRSDFAVWASLGERVVELDCRQWTRSVLSSIRPKKPVNRIWELGRGRVLFNHADCGGCSLWDDAREALRCTVVDLEPYHRDSDEEEEEGGPRSRANSRDNAVGEDDFFQDAIGDCFFMPGCAVLLEEQMLSFTGLGVRVAKIPLKQQPEPMHVKVKPQLLNLDSVLFKTTCACAMGGGEVAVATSFNRSGYLNVMI